jgi:hypothetical protein
MGNYFEQISGIESYDTPPPSPIKNEEDAIQPVNQDTAQKNANSSNSDTKKKNIRDTNISTKWSEILYNGKDDYTGKSMCKDESEIEHIIEIQQFQKIIDELNVKGIDTPEDLIKIINDEDNLRCIHKKTNAKKGGIVRRKKDPLPLAARILDEFGEKVGSNIISHYAESAQKVVEKITKLINDPNQSVENVDYYKKFLKIFLKNREEWGINLESNTTKTRKTNSNETVTEAKSSKTATEAESSETATEAESSETASEAKSSKTSIGIGSSKLGSEVKSSKISTGIQTGTYSSSGSMNVYWSKRWHFLYEFNWK